MITLKEYEIYLKVKKFIEAENCDENDIILRLISGVGIIPAYVPLVIESDDMEPTKYYSLSAAARSCGIPKQTIIYAYRNGRTRIVRRKGGTKEFRIEWLALPRWQSPARRWINLTSRLNCSEIEDFLVRFCLGKL